MQRIKSLPHIRSPDGCACENRVGEKRTPIFSLLIPTAFMLAAYFGSLLLPGTGLPDLNNTISYGLIFVTGLITGLHCIGMCGGFVLTYTAVGISHGASPFGLHLSYAAGKTLSYSFLGALFGLLGNVVSFSLKARGIIGILSGILLLLLGLKMFDVFPRLKRFGSYRLSRLGSCYSQTSRNLSNPLLLGLLNGFMITCGPLQAMYLFSAANADPLKGAFMLFVFGLGTLPMMLGFGYVASILSRNLRHKILHLSGSIVILFGFVAMNQGLAIMGSGYDFLSVVTKLEVIPGNRAILQSNSLSTSVQTIEMSVTTAGWSPNKFVVEKNIPVKWIIYGDEINSCNRAIQVPSLDLSFEIKKGLNVVEFTPQKKGIISWSCWMGMMQGTFMVVDSRISVVEEK